MIDLPTDLVEFLSWFVYGGGGAILISWILERAPWYQEKPSNVKQNIYFGMVTIFTLIVYAIMTYVPADILAALTPWFGIIATAFISIYVGTGFHRASTSSPQVVANEATVVAKKDMSVKVETPKDIYEIKG